ncbi:hypothetical protein PIB30_026224 [Stylosanthes scabra]|uniref:FAR1 domain-containing protein n=1 Tax=Stylosanthes scabra TaxID=79078 RepID=A0ABU6QAS7_9FABA|nr:hypothetical protein [Stylosanthes scabra]
MLVFTDAPLTYFKNVKSEAKGANLLNMPFFVKLMRRIYIPKVGMTFETLEEAGLFYKKKGKWTYEVPRVEKTNPLCGAKCPARIFVHVEKKTSRWRISKVVRGHSHPCFPDQCQMLAQHRELSLDVRQTIEINDLSRIRPCQTYQSLVTAAGGHNELGFIEKDEKLRR